METGGKIISIFALIHLTIRDTISALKTLFEGDCEWVPADDQDTEIGIWCYTMLSEAGLS